MLAFTIAHLSICRLRYSEPDRDRPYRVPLSIRLQRRRAAAAGGVRRARLRRRVAGRDDRARTRALRRASAGWRSGSRCTSSTAAPMRRRCCGGSPSRRRCCAPSRHVERDYGSILVPLLGHQPRRRHRADRRAAGLRRAHRRRRDRHRDDRGPVDLRDADVAAAGRAPARGAGQARAPGARARQGGGGGVHGRAGRDGHGAHPARRATRSWTRPAGAAWRRSCSAPRSPRASAAARVWEGAADRWRTTSATSPSTSCAKAGCRVILTAPAAVNDAREDGERVAAATGS